MKTPHHSALGLLRLLLIASVAVPFVLTVMLGWFTYRSNYQDNLREVVWTSVIAREHAARVFDTQELVIERVLDLIKGMDDAAVRSAEPRLHENLKAILADLSTFLSVIVTDRNGRLLLSSTVSPAPDIDFSDRDYFQALFASPERRAVSKVQESRVDGRTFFGLSRSRLDAQGRFDGVVDIAISPKLFVSFYETLVRQDHEQHDGRVVEMIRDDGQMLARYPATEAALPTMPASSGFVASVARNPEKGLYVAPAVVDPLKSKRLYAYDKVVGYPLYIVAGHSLGAIFVEWRRQMLWYSAGIIPATATLFGATLVTIRRTRRERTALAQAQDEISRRELAEAALHRAQRLEAVGQLTGGIAHDFNNLLTIIVGNVDMMVRRAEDPERVRRLGGNVLLAAKRVADVTDKLLAFSRRRVVRPEVVDINQLLEELQLLLTQAVSRLVVIRFDFAPEDCPVRIDPGQFESALINLVVNARDAMPHGGTLSITTRRRQIEDAGLRDAPELPPGYYVGVAVSDSGAGMDAATMAKAFEPFFTTKEVGKGTGLGLSQVYGFTKQAGGHVRIESLLGKGTCVEMILPRSDEEPRRDRSASDESGPMRSLRQETVLVVEDEPGLRDMAIESLQDLGYRTIAACDAAQALRHIQDGVDFDLLFSDIVMPGGMDGIALAREARRLRPSLAVVLTSGYTDANGGASIPADIPLLRKPYTREDLATEVGRLLGRTMLAPP